MPKRGDAVRSGPLADRYSLALLALIATVAAIAYWPSFSVPYQFDDYARISGNWHLQQRHWIKGIAQMGGVRILPSATLALNFAISGNETWSFHVVNLAVHLLATVFVFCLAWSLSQTPRLAGTEVAARPRFFAACAAALFACHPLQTQAVTYIVQRSAAMATMFYVASAYAYVAGRLAQASDRSNGYRHFALAIAAAAAALLSKENAVTLPLAIVLIEVAFFGRRQLRNLLRAGMWLAPVVALPVLLKLVAWWIRAGGKSKGSLIGSFLQAVFSQGWRDGPAVESLDYFLTQMIVLPRYLRLVALPFGLNVDHDVPLVEGVDAVVIAGMLSLAALLAVAVLALRRAPLLAFGLLWFFLTLSLESSFIPLYDTMMEHRMYMAMPGVAVLVAACLAYFDARHASAAKVAACAMVAVLSVLTFERNQVWQSALSLWSDAAEKSPGKARVHVNVGVAHHGRGELDEAIASYCRAIAADASVPVARDNIEIALEQQGRLQEVLRRVELSAVDHPSAPEGSIVLDYDLSSVVCRSHENGERR